MMRYIDSHYITLHYICWNSVIQCTMHTADELYQVVSLIMVCPTVLTKKSVVCPIDVGAYRQTDRQNHRIIYRPCTQRRTVKMY